ncbi:sensor domain-containing diguanylate cyclase [Ferrimonas sp. SCSIO 43195]|uniref:sensor domain-containing diguanylate cyclase n=1 Tax=Ferrimonas sp. SCSIO 43195 TaxID=2822844 RepID=UPI0020762C80|nr:sensor domain-containing diguanylate cyclase [Ferrimonas sp. SCSIO 43195]USD37566.1 sensor domain-containing diguanylate cyclase [Ferrimonas sp. SCSIO 43195]
MQLQDVKILPVLESHAQKQWQHLLEMLSQVTGMPGAYLSRCSSQQMQILSTNHGCPPATQAGEQFPILDLYCEQVMSSGEHLAVDDAWRDPKWAHGRETRAGIISYLGLPVRQPNGFLFGTLCIYDTQPREHCHQWLALMQSVVNIIESDLSLLEVGKALATESMTDPLTGLYNRRGMEARLDELLSLGRRLASKSPGKLVLGMMMMDIDHFKRVNDTFGHIVGDQLLQHFSALLTDNVRCEDMAVRWGGEEFMLLIPCIGARQLAVLAEKIRLTVMAAPLPLPDQPLPFTVSIGYGGLNCAHLSGDALEQLDQLMLKAKSLGRNRCYGLSSLA